MPKPQILFACTKCDAQATKWSGRCLDCGAWGTVKETNAPSNLATKQPSTNKIHPDKIIAFTSISSQDVPRRQTNIGELDRLLGGGIVPGSLILLGGEPGIGKSTLMLHIIKQLEGAEAPLLYLSGEESAQQIKIRADRLNVTGKNLHFVAATNVHEMIAAIAQLKPALAIIDSIQTISADDVEAEAGSVTQIRACTVKLLECAKGHNIPIILTGHVTKDGAVAGPKTLEHLVDVVLYLEGDKYHGYRVLRSVKNRFGSTNEIGLFEMTSAGLTEVTNPSQALIQPNAPQLSGTVFSCVAEGSRAFLTEIQALVTPTIFGYPQRKTAGFDINRLQMLSAVLTKRSRLNLLNQDIHLNIAGGFKSKEPALDLAVCAAILSAMKNIPIPRQTIVIGEVGLGGEVRPVFNLEKRLKEAAKMHFTNAIIPKQKLTEKIEGLAIMQIGAITEFPLN